MKQLEVQIMGQSYLLGCPEGGDQQLLQAVERVDSAMCKIRDGGKIKARDRIAVLAALNLAFDLTDQSPQAPVAQGSTTTAEHDPALASLLQRLDVALADCLDRPMEQVDPIERAVLRIAALELRDRLDVPYRVILNEAIEIAKRFGSDHGHTYVNGVLDQAAGIWRQPELNARRG
jgi:cell division protein ZapA